MFTGIIETLGTVEEILHSDANCILKISSLLGSELKVDQSLSHNGICLTVTAIDGNLHTVCAVPETLAKTTLKHWKKGDQINLERCVPMNGRLDGHIVQGHVDTIGLCTVRMNQSDHWTYRFSFPAEFAHLIIEKGSVSVNGTSLTCFNISKDEFEVAIIPYTFEHTSIQFVHSGDAVNLEFDVLGKYITRWQSLQ
ncbi:MAG: riboflavin synthase [Chitinophagaceae bacterium]|nr:riboflavin synthase [Chitinophagaceae bacterium]